MTIILWIIGIFAFLFGVLYVGAQMMLPTPPRRSMLVQILSIPFAVTFTVLWFVISWIVSLFRCKK